MNYIYVDKIKNFVNYDSKELLNVFKSNYKKFYGKLELQQQNAWESSIKYLQNIFNSDQISNLTLAFEYMLPFSNERVDLLIFGKGKNERPTIVLVELKGWKAAKKTRSNYIIVSDIGESVHPEYQVENYTGKLKFSHSAIDKFDIIPAILMYNADPKSIELDFIKVDCFYKNDSEKFINFIKSHLESPLDRNVINEFLEGDYKQSKRLFEAILKHYNEIKTRSYLTLAENGWGLSSEQLELVEEIIKDLDSGKKDLTYFVQGAPGSGKTLVAIHLLLSGLTRGYQTILAYRNNRLINSIRTVFQSCEPGLSNPIKFYSVGPRANFRGVAEKNFQGRQLDLVIYDEAQRMTRENIHYAINRGKITVFFYDEGQILNAEEEGYTRNFVNAARSQSKIIKQKFLKGFYRVEGGERYHNFVEKLLKNPENISGEFIIPWKENYEFKVFEYLDELIKTLEIKRNKGSKVALIAAFTESPGDLKNKKSIKNLRIGYPLYSRFELYKNFEGEIYWLMDPKKDYVPFWVEGDSNKLEKCASIYGCQGFETDFAGIIWGRDFVYNDGIWELGRNCEDNIGKPSLKELMQKAKNGNVEAKNLVIFLLINRYRIFLTRGIKGTYIFCEDSDTADFLMQIYNMFID